MGRLKKRGNIGQVSGTVGDVVVSEWNNIPVVRSRAAKSSKPATAGQQVQRAKMAAAVKFAMAIKKVLSLGFKSFAVEMSGYNAGVSDILKYAITGDYPNLSINFSKARVSWGRLHTEANAAAKADAGQVVFTWTHENDAEIAATDKAILVVYCEALNKSLFTINGPDRTTGTAYIAVGRFKGYDVHTWLAFVSVNGEEVSPSTYTGKFTIT